MERRSPRHAAAQLLQLLPRLERGPVVLQARAAPPPPAPCRSPHAAAPPAAPPPGCSAPPAPAALSSGCGPPPSARRCGPRPAAPGRPRRRRRCSISRCRRLRLSCSCSRSCCSGLALRKASIPSLSWRSSSLSQSPPLWLMARGPRGRGGSGRKGAPPSGPGLIGPRDSRTAGGHEVSDGRLAFAGSANHCHLGWADQASRSESCCQRWLACPASSRSSSQSSGGWPLASMV